MRAISRALGSVFRGIYDRAGQVSPDDALLAAIERLDQVSTEIIEQDSRGRALDDAANNR